MKISGAALAVLLGVTTVEGFISPPRPSVRSVSLELCERNEKKNESWGTAVAAAVAGWSLASQVVFAGMLPNNVDRTLPDYGSSIEVAARTETMDFSMPSYDSFSDDASKAKKSEGAPSFNPFGDFQPGFADTDKKPVEEKAPVVDKAAEKAAAEAEAAAKKAEKEARLKAEKEKQEAAKAASEAEAAAKKAEKEARLKAEKEKQEAAVAARVKDDAMATPELKVPDIDFKAPDLSGLKLSVPKIDIPKVDTPNVDLPSFAVPKVDIPKFDVPKVDIPKVNIPKFDTPDVSIPKVDIPQVSIPKASVPFLGGGESKPSSGTVMLEPREVRDENARQAKQAFAEADQAAKDIEAQAREARNFANGKKQAAKEARDLACADRPGGKFLCLRNPFSTGF